MKIKITKPLPVAAEVRPIVGSVHEVVKTEQRDRRRIHFIKVGNAQVGVFSAECEVVER